jgi:thiamine-monophosphate kinase
MVTKKSAIRTVADLGEFGLIARIAGMVNRTPPVEGLRLGMGDDAAALEFPAGTIALATTDIMVEGVHFQRDAQSPRVLGRRIMAVNLSDIAAMGGLPQFALLSLGLPQELPVDFVDELYEGILIESRLFGFGIAGGNIAASPDRLILDVTMLGAVEPYRMLKRSGAHVGDSIMVTGQMGSSAAGLAAILHKPSVDVPAWAREYAKTAHTMPRPRVREGRLIAESGCATAMIDTSDGLAGDLGHVCEASGMGAVIYENRLPIADATRALAESLGTAPASLALYGGEDYELLFTVRPGCERDVELTLRETTGTMAKVIGEILPISEGITVRYADGSRQPLAPRGFDHLRGGVS